MISVVLPALNEGQLLERTIRGMLPVTPSNSQIIVVDNGSTDGSTGNLQQFAEVELLKYDKPLGAAKARNVGAQAAKNEFIVFCDAHVDVVGEWWRPLINRLGDQKIGIVGASIGMMDNPKYDPSFGQRLIADPILRPEWLRSTDVDKARPVMCLGAGCFAIRKSTFDEMGGFDEGMPMMQYEDTEICLRYWLMGYEVWIEPASRIDHYFRTEAPYETSIHNVNYNLLRMAFLHFNPQRLARIVEGVRGRGGIGLAIAKLLLDDEVRVRKQELLAKQVRGDNWLFNKFRGECKV